MAEKIATPRTDRQRKSKESNNLEVISYNDRTTNGLAFWVVIKINAEAS